MPDDNDDFWSQFERDAVKFNQPGDAAIGTIVKMERADMQQPDGRIDQMPRLHLMGDDGKVRTVLCGPRNLQDLLSQRKPRVGQRIKIAYVSSTPLGGGKAAKNFAVEVRDLTPEEASASNATSSEAAEEPF